MPKKKSEPYVPPKPPYNERLKLLVEKDGQWYEVDGGLHWTTAYGWVVWESLVAQTIRDLGPIPYPKRWRDA